jgi:hypothetical protein
MTWREVVAVGLAGACISACGGSDPGLIVLKNSQSGQLVQCRGVSGDNRDLAAQEAESCAQAYEQEGYVRVSK